MKNKQHILVLAPHTDDGEIGCGATIARFIEEGKDVHYVAFSICEESVPEGFPSDILDTEVRKATRELGIPSENLTVLDYRVRRFSESRQAILEQLVALNRSLKPDLVFLPSSFDIHQDHSTIHEEGIRAFKNTSLLGYEFMWNNFSFSSSALVVVEERHVERKIASVACYESQAGRFYASDSLLRGQANFRGLQVSAEYAEAFEVIRMIL